MALLLVLWAGTLLAILLGGYAVLARTQGLQARYRVAQTQAHYAAQAGLMRAIQALYDAPTRRWVADGRSYRIAFGQAQVEVSAVGENGKVDCRPTRRSNWPRISWPGANRPRPRA